MDKGYHLCSPSPISRIDFFPRKPKKRIRSNKIQNLGADYISQCND